MAGAQTQYAERGGRSTCPGNADAGRGGSGTRSGTGRKPSPAAGSRFYETQEQAELREFLRRLRDEGRVTDPAHIRIDTFCGRLTHPTAYRVSVYVPDASLGR
ncbi:hypothetical protein [Streptomyces amritsarensis]|uniref:hypothetical protein n=1 Tax=Streptomyces amritsarensis TaxID=681158 RepID=UPI0009A1F58F|nr:hypothetical protein [Streptomyces amritsarensis]